MRNRDHPAAPATVKIGPEMRDWATVPGLTKREDSAARNMAQLLGSYGALPGEDEEMKSMASAAVQATDALFDELEKGDG